MITYTHRLQEIVDFGRNIEFPFSAFRDDSVIDAFLQLDDYKIIPRSDVPDEIVTSPNITPDEAFDTEELAEVYLAQGLTEPAIAIYRRMGLVNPEKSRYFAKIIREIENSKID